jgi:uncharacterized coiled-coil protein SlyX
MVYWFKDELLMEIKAEQIKQSIMETQKEIFRLEGVLRALTQVLQVLEKQESKPEENKPNE